ncbi:GNAT family N-acetyltransferase [Bacillus cereus]|uniref:GNAT family N-acetyltransferase n=1 Tax=Bacillus TaxID=1386 RepID=UPI000BEE7B91|nr:MULTISPECIES: GNAT family protein [Bacillus]PEB81151.1 GNAT family N-acetyltransferase [Bacillus cereus]MED0906580.1 GNAT family protein [Bacillus nitratireducens]PEE14353.1 GNAT family N-acetyltransferase [Bacillus cereus]PES81869.1 GNAT family N-acetyltransferase [Bacillus cereus]PET08399.1 GNAT family N-acetyltransferase [Bacillus cereus]
MFVKAERLLIRKFEFKDWQSVHEYTSDINVMKYIPEGVFTEEDTRNFVNENIGKNAKNFPVVLIDENILIGHIVFHEYFGEHTYEIGWVFNPKYFNKGYASEAAQAILKYGFKEMKLHRIIATCQPQNTPSYRVMEKIGMRREGYFRKCIPHGNEWWDEYYYAILEEE